ncbi:hypothetical protein H2200_005144 [Cladophialophora chaetospira]|uniref:Uncharacterized protein n=1 Tax=Cladophialophora chaetospira TaxID=386627 RepID=A0AA39CJB3_9EURO|nr:hypothetical protein H2200_005144 [Cladophialophora chaetospira]
MLRNKENNPLSTTQRNGLHARNQPSEEFFTDSILDDSRHSNISLIPSPSKAKAKPAPVKPRRAVPTAKALQAAKDFGNKQTRTSLLDYTNARLNRQGQQLKPPPKFAKRKSSSPSPSPVRTNGLTTPPQSRHGPPVRSPSEFSSPPGGLNESYQRIADEEDLAATERDVDSDDDEVEPDQQDTFGSNADVNPTPDADDAVGKGTSEDAHASEHSTPVQAPVNLDEMSGSFSAPPTLDFVQNEMSDRVLAAKLTPHFIDRARDRQRLQRLRQSVPINFGDAPNEHQIHAGPKRNDLASIANRGPINFDNIPSVDANGFQRAHSDTSADVTLNKRFTAFGKAARKAPKKPDPEDDDGSDTPDELREVERTLNLNQANRRRGKLAGETEHPSGQEQKRAPFSRSYDQPRAYGAPLPMYDDLPLPDDPTVASVSSVRSEPISVATADKRTTDATRSFLARWRHETAQKRAAKALEDEQKAVPRSERAASARDHLEERRHGDGNESEVDWAAAGADVPVPSIEKSSTPRDTPPPKVLPSPISKQRSIDRIRKWENDFTGMSFQVSESPPVRGRNALNDSFREKEMEDLTKQAVTSNRLDEIRVKDPNVVVRKTSRSFTPEERKPASREPREGDSKDVGRAIPDTPIVVYRSSSQSTDKSKASQGSMPDSLEQLQRLVRAVSTTPKASPALQNMVREVEEASAISLPPSEEDLKRQSPEARTNGLHINKRVAETPRVIGAWTDTILPDTVKTQKQKEKLSKYAQTPQVSAGGWIDTPLPNGDRLPRIPIPDTVEEVTEDITDDHIQQPNDEVTETQERLDLPIAPREEQQTAALAPSASQQIILPPSALTNVLNEAKQKRLASRDLADARPASRDETETLNLGDATIQSMEDLLTDAADITADLTTLIKTNAQEEVLALRQRSALLAPDGVGDGDSSTSDVAFIGHLTSRMERLMSNLHEARKGISRLEQRVSNAPAGTLGGSSQEPQALVTGHDSTQPCAACGRSADDLMPHDHSHATKVTSFLAIPIAHTTFTLPIPLLFHPRTAANPKPKHKVWSFLPGRPTWLGYLTLTVWTWYILECTMTELYARPLYATQYTFPPPGVREPEFPFVLPTMLSRWTFGGYGSLLAAPLVGLIRTLARLFVAIYRILAMAVGWSDGFVDDQRANNVGAKASRIAVKVAESLVPDSEGLSMMNDEIL